MVRKTQTVSAVPQGGFTLLEILVAIVVLSIGLLGLASLQAVGLRTNQSAYLRSQATLLAEDMADRMRANNVAVQANAYDLPVANLSANCRTAAGCSANEMAQNDYAEWTATLAGVFPNGEGVVCIDSTPNDGAGAGNPACDGTAVVANNPVYTIKVWWDDYDREQDAGTRRQRFVMSVQLTPVM
jgi:type IV pilus assembly protein PilV